MRKPEMKSAPMRLGGNLKAMLRDCFTRIERLNEKIDALNADKSEVYSEAKALGLDVKTMRIVIARRGMDRADVEERDALVQIYESVLAGTKSATRARAREDAEDGDE